MNWSSHTSSKISRTWMNVSILWIKTKVFTRFFIYRITNCFDTLSKSGKYSPNISSLLHGYDTQLIFLIDPDQESFVGIVEDTATFWPISFHASNSQVPVSGYKQEVIINQLLSHILLHPCQGVVLTSKVSREILDCILHEFFYPQTLFFSYPRRETKSINWATNTNSARMHWDICFDITLNFLSIHVWGVFRIGRNPMIFLYEWIKNRGKIFIGIPVASINSTMLVVKFHSACNSLDQSESRCSCLFAFQFLPYIFCYILCNKRMFGFDLGEWSISLSCHSLGRCGRFQFSCQNFLIFLPQGVYSIYHFLNQLDLRVSKPVLVGNVVCYASLTTWFTTSSSWLEMKFLTSNLKSIQSSFCPPGKINMNGCSHTSSKVSWTGMYVSILRVEHKIPSWFFLDRLLNCLNSSWQSFKHGLYISTLLHWDYAKLILLIDPN